MVIKRLHIIGKNYSNRELYLFIYKAKLHEVKILNSHTDEQRFNTKVSYFYNTDRHLRI